MGSLLKINNNIAMKNILRFVLFLTLSALLYSQTNISDIRDRISLKGPVQLPDSVYMALLVEQIMQIYGDSFNYYAELKSNKYKFKFKDSKNSEYGIEIINDNKKGIEIKVKKIESPLGGYILTLNTKDIEKLITQQKTSGSSNQQGSPITIIERNNIIVDKEILPFEELQPEERRILDKEFTTQYFVDQYNNDLELYKMCQAGKLFPYSGGHSKMVTVDDEYSSLIYFDEGLSDDSDDPLNRCFGSFGDDRGEFMNPLGMCVGRMHTEGNNDIYPLFITDMNNLRIRSVNFIANNTFSELGTIDKGSFSDIAIVTYPYDIAYFYNGIDSSEDKLWVSQAHPTQNFLTCLSNSGAEIQRFSGYKNSDNNETYFFEPGTLTRLAVYNNGFGCLCFIDNVRNCLVSCLLNSDGTGNVLTVDDRNDYIIANEVIPFPKDQLINSVSFQKTPLASNQWVSLWVTSPSYVHHLKMNKSANIQYLASANLPRT